MGDACDERVDVRLPFTGEIRSTSKRKYILPRAYTEPLRRMKSIYNVTDILFATDLQEVIDWALSSMTEFNWHYQDFDRSSLEEGRGWIEKRSDIRRRETESANIEMNMLSRGHVFVGSLCSHFSRTILWAIAGRRIMLPP